MRRLALVLAALALSAVLAPPASALEGTFGVSPGEIVVADAQKGETYVRRILVSNQFDEETLVNATPKGDLAPWVTVSPSGPFAVPAFSRATIEIAIAVPASALNGTHLGRIEVIADSGEAPDGNGVAVRTGAAVKLNVTIGGEVVERARLTDASAPDVEQGTPPSGSARVRNDGNVRTTVEILVEVFDADGNLVGTVRMSRSLLPGQEEDVPFTFEDDLPPGTYRMRITTQSASGSTEEVRSFKVVPPGTLGKNGRIARVDHPSFGSVGTPVRITIVFENTGNVTIARAAPSGEVLRGGALVAPLAGDGLVVAAGRSANLTLFFTPTSPGEHAIALKVVYDGFETLTQTSLLTAFGGAEGSILDALKGPWLLPILVAILLFLLAWRKRPPSPDESGPEG